MEHFEHLERHFIDYQSVLGNQFTHVVVAKLSLIIALLEL